MSVEADGYCVYGKRIEADDLKSCFDYDLIAAKYMDGADPEDVWIDDILWQLGLDDYFVGDCSAYSDDYWYYFGTILHTGIELDKIKEGVEKVDSILLSLDNTDNGFDYDKFCSFTEAQNDQIWIFTRWH